MPQKVKNKITSQCMLVCIVYYLQSILSVLLPLFYPPPSFLLPFPLLLSYPLVAIATAVAGAVLTALILLAAAAAVACSACACTRWCCLGTSSLGAWPCFARTSCPSCSSVSCWYALTCSTASSGGGAGGGPGVSLTTGRDQKHYLINLASAPQDEKNVTAIIPQGKKRYLCGVISKRYGMPRTLIMIVAFKLHHKPTSPLTPVDLIPRSW